MTELFSLVTSIKIIVMFYFFFYFALNVQASLFIFSKHLPQLYLSVQSYKVSPVASICSVFKIAFLNFQFSPLLVYPTHSRKITLAKTQLLSITLLFKNILWLTTALGINIKFGAKL